MRSGIFEQMAKKIGKKSKKKKAFLQQKPGTQKARLVLKHAKNSVKHFLDSFDSIRAGALGAPTDGQQDLLRASLVFAAAGLDSAVKELIRGCLPALAESDEGVKKEFSEFAKRKLRGDDSANDALAGIRTNYLARILTAPAPQVQLLEDYVHDLTGSSLQSAGELAMASKALGIKSTDLLPRDVMTRLKDIFAVRNCIIHELDVYFGGRQGQRQRNSRQKANLKSDAEFLVEIASNMIDLVDKKLDSSTP